MATAEFAVVMPVVVLVLALSLSALGAGLDQIRCVDAARAAARLLARGEADGAARRAGEALAPDGSELVVSADAMVVRVRVTAPAPWALQWLGHAGQPSAEVVATREDALAEVVP
jgi:hypothetical protein